MIRSRKTNSIIRFSLLAGGLILLSNGALSAQAVSADGAGEISWHPYALSHNEKSRLNPDNHLELQNLINAATARYWFDAYFGDFLQLSGSFKITADNARGKRLMSTSSSEDYSDLGDVSLGFEQLYFEWTTPNYWNIGYGKYPLRYGYSRVYSPLNYTARTLDYRDTLGQWNGWFKGNVGMVNFALNYLPSIRFRDKPNDKTEAERFFKDMETLLDRQALIFSLSGFFFDSLDTSLYLNLQDKGDYAFKKFYIAAGGGFSWSILDKLIWRTEFLYGNGYDDLKTVQSADGLPPALPQKKYSSRDLDAYYAKVLTGLTVNLPGDIELSVEYFYNGAGLPENEKNDFIDALKVSGEALGSSTTADIASAHKGFLAGGVDNWKIYELGRHYAFLQLRKLNIFQKLDFINSSILLADDLSFVNITSLDYTFSDSFTLGAELRFFVFREDGAYSLSPEAVRFDMEATYSF